jgi:hypothetical protein
MPRRPDPFPTLQKIRREFRKAGVLNAPRSPRHRSIIRNAPTSKVAKNDSIHSESQARLQAVITELEKIMRLARVNGYKGLVSWLSRRYVLLASHDCGGRAPAEATVFLCNCRESHDLRNDPLWHWIHSGHREFNCAVMEILRIRQVEFLQYLRDHIDGLDPTDDDVIYLVAICKHLLTDPCSEWLIERPPVQPVWAKRGQ